MQIDIDINKLNRKKRESLYWFLYDYEYHKRVGKKCRSCGHVLGQINNAELKLGYTSNSVVRFCRHHQDTVWKIIKKKGYNQLLLKDLFDTLEMIKQIKNA